MTADTIITDGDAHPDNWTHESVLILNGDDDPQIAVKKSLSFNKVMIVFSGSHDGRGFSLARQLREEGYTGSIRAKGALVPDQWRHLRKTGFDDLALSKDQLAKMPVQVWKDVQQLTLPDYQQRIIGKR